MPAAQVNPTREPPDHADELPSPHPPSLGTRSTENTVTSFKGDSYDNALAEAFNSLFKAELIRNKGPWTGINDLEIAVAEYIDWFNQRRLHGELGHVTPAEHEAAHYPVAEPSTSLQKSG